MKPRKKWLFAAVVLVAMACAILVGLMRQPRYQGRPLSAWLNDLSSDKSEVRSAAEKAIREMGPAAVPYLTNSLAKHNALSLRFYRKNIVPRAWLRDLSATVKWHSPIVESQNASLALSMIGPGAEAAIPELMAALRDISPVVQQSAARALGAIGPPSVPHLRERLRISGAADQVWALIALGYIGTNAVSAAPDVANLLGQPPLAGDYATATLALLGPGAIPVAAESLAHTNPLVRARAATALGQMGPKAESAAHDLIAAADDPDAKTRFAIWQAIEGVRAPPELKNPVWLKGLQDPIAQNAQMALQYLSYYPKAIREHSNQVAALLDHASPALREMASNVLVRSRAWPKK